MPKLYEISADLTALDALIEELGGDISDPRVEQTITEWFQGLQGEVSAKADAYAYYIRQLDALAAVADAEEEHWHKKRRALETRSAWLKNRMLGFLDTHNISSIQTDRFNIHGQTNGTQAMRCIEDPTKVPVEFRRYDATVDTRAVREALESGRTLDFAELLPKGRHLRIK